VVKAKKTNSLASSSSAIAKRNVMGDVQIEHFFLKALAKTNHMCRVSPMLTKFSGLKTYFFPGLLGLPPVLGKLV
jgi:hypothetical protein